MSLAKTVLRNTLSNWMGLLISTVITVLLTPYLLRHLGSERYGIYNLAFAILHYLVLLEFGIRGAVARFAAKYIQAADSKSLNGVISAAMMVAFILGTISILLSCLIGFLAVDFFDIPPAFHGQAVFLFVAMGVNLMLSLLCYSLSGVLIGSQRYDLQNVQLILVTSLRAGLVVLFFSLGWISLAGWALAMVLASLTGLLYLSITAKILQPRLRINPVKVDMNILKEMLGFGKWNLGLQLSGMVNSSANPIIIGRIIGAAAVPFYSIPYMLVTRLQAGVSGLTSTLMPHASAALHTGDKTMLAHLLKKGTYTAALLAFPLGGCLVIMCRDLFRVWLPPEFESYWIIFGIFMAAYFGEITQTTSYFILLGGGEIRGLSKAYLSAAVLLIGLSVVFLKFFAWGVYGAALSLAIPRILAACIFQPWYAARQAQIGFWTYLRDSYTKPALFTVPSLVLAWLLVTFLPPSNLFFWAVEFCVALMPFGFFLLTGLLESPVQHPALKAVQQKFAGKFRFLTHKRIDI